MASQAWDPLTSSIRDRPGPGDCPHYPGLTGVSFHPPEEGMKADALVGPWLKSDQRSWVYIASGCVCTRNHLLPPGEDQLRAQISQKIQTLSELCVSGPRVTELKAEPLS